MQCVQSSIASYKAVNDNCTRILAFPARRSRAHHETRRAPVHCWRSRRHCRSRRLTREYGATARHSSRPLSRYARVTPAVHGSQVVSGCQVRHLVALGPAVGHRAWRLVCTLHVRPDQRPVSLSGHDLRPSLQGRLQRSLSPLEGRRFRSRTPDGFICQGRRKILRQHGRASR